jgi:hypothetical protein
MNTYSVFYTNGENDTYRAKDHVRVEGVYILQDSIDEDGMIIEIHIPTANVFAIAVRYDVEEE